MRGTTKSGLGDRRPRLKLGPGTQELRIATAMTGGVSLAIWMGGVARELNLLQQAAWWRDGLPEDAALPEAAASATGDERAKALYLRLLDLLDTTVCVDILSGTSAGGINAALLGLARARSWDLGPLRDFWLTSGAFETLLRDPDEKRPPSLLQGDGVLFQELVDGIADLGVRASSTPPLPGSGDDDATPRPPRTTRVLITTTLLTGETGRFTDSYGTQVQDDDHRGLLVFDEEALADEGGKQAVALAARSSASYPAAFEPSFLPYDTAIPGRPGAPERPPMREYANITRPHWVADGGLLANRPIRPLLRAVFERPAARQVRRVLLYVVPTAGGAPDPRPTPAPESFEQPWTLGEALAKDLGAALNQSVSAELTELRDHNDRMDALRDTRRRMAELGAQGRAVQEELAACRRRLAEATGAPADEAGTPAPGCALLGPAMRDDFRGREGAWLARPVIAALMRALTTRPYDAMTRAWLDALGPGRSAEEECRAAAVTETTREWRFPEPGDEGTALYQRLAAFGVAPFNGAKATVLALLREAHVCCPDRRHRLADVVERVHEAYEPPPRPNLEDLVEEVLDEGYAAGWPLPRVAAEAMKRYAPEPAGPATGPGSDSRRDPRLQNGWERLAAAVVALRDIVPDALLAPPGTGVLAPPASAEGRRQRAAAELLAYFGFLPARADGTALALFELHVATRSVLPVGTEIEQPVELVQVSADTRCLLAHRRATAASKLTGLQLHHFGAFYKSSWRANDWTWGRLDGAGWLVHLLLDPRRILTVVPEHPPTGSRGEWFYAKLRELFAAGADPDDVVAAAADGSGIRLTERDVLGELGFLDDAGAPLPRSLPLTSMWVAKAWQRCVVEVELPVLAREVMATPSARGHTWAAQVLDAAGRPARAQAAARTAEAAVVNGTWTPVQRGLVTTALLDGSPAAAPDPDALAALLATCPVPDETFADELGRPLLTRTASKAAAVTASLASGLGRIPAPLRPFVSSARTVTLAGYRASALSSGASRNLLLIGLVALVVGVLSMFQQATWLGLTGVVLALIGGYLLALGGYAHWRKVLVGAGTFTLVVAVFFLACPIGRRWLFGNDHGDVGAFGRHALPWLRAPWWHPLVALGALVALALLLSGLFGALRRRERAPAVVPLADSGPGSGVG
ncbi:patatin-like protein [Streptomyces sp. NPDC005209]|uniref:patatin-like protein n=1 Tax=Streptomyces sp. NPDC005209 TaxID=3156715 RepID=UPI0033A34DFE